MSLTRDPLADVPERGIIDCHGHVGPWHNFMIRKASPEQLMEMMDLCRIEQIWVSANVAIGPDSPSGNEYVGQLVRRHPGRIRGYAVINPNYPARTRDELRRGFDELGLEAIKLHPSTHSYPLDGPSYRPAFEFAAERRTFVLTHTWGGSATCTPSMLTGICRDFPETPILVGHAGGKSLKGLAEAFELVLQYSNTYLDITGSAFEHGKLEAMVERVGDQRVLFGSDATFLDPRPAIGFVSGARLEKRSKQRIFRENMANLTASLGMP